MLEVDEDDEDGAVDADDVVDAALDDELLSEGVLVEPVPEAALFDDRESLR